MLRPASSIDRDLGSYHPNVHELWQEVAHRPSQILNRGPRIKLPLYHQQQPVPWPPRREFVQYLVGIYPCFDRLGLFQVGSQDGLCEVERHLFQVRRGDWSQNGVDIGEEARGVGELDFHMPQGRKTSKGGMVKAYTCLGQCQWLCRSQSSA